MQTGAQNIFAHSEESNGEKWNEISYIKLKFDINYLPIICLIIRVSKHCLIRVRTGCQILRQYTEAPGNDTSRK